ncbi:class I SAM-dependent methyltransferase [Nonomuraea sp. NPDC048916]|uniref:class I SAM-dependent methyltransferase n=1 Tax=Nonomuraea sp. NPDC048916 TaxID=3154232 RepID=UPI0033E55D99
MKHLDERAAELADAQREQWRATYTAHPGLYGRRPSEPAVYAADLFTSRGASDVLELGAGHGRDTLHFAGRGLAVHATDFCAEALAQLRQAADRAGLGERVRVSVHDAREPLPLNDASVDAVYAHMLLCMALSTEQIHALAGEVRRVLRPGGSFVYTVRHVGDAHHGTGISHGDDIYEHGGFAVHFFTRALVEALAEGWVGLRIHAFEEGELPRRLWRVTQRLP